MDLCVIRVHVVYKKQGIRRVSAGNVFVGVELKSRQHENLCQQWQPGVSILATLEQRR